MSKQALHFKFLIGLIVFTFAVGPTTARSESSGSEPDYSLTHAGTYRDIFEQNIYYEATGLLDFGWLYRRIMRHPLKAKDVNIFDEVPDNTFFTNRHARKRLSSEELEKGYRVSGGMDLSGNLTIVDSEFETHYPEYMTVRDAKGEEYSLEFDPPEYPGLMTGAEVAASRFMYAIGYNVPDYTVTTFAPSKLVVDQNSKTIDNSGFEKRLTTEKLDQMILFMAKDMNGNFRASVMKLPPGDLKGGFHYRGRRMNDPDDKVDHQYRREIRALRVFGSWLNFVQISDCNSMDILMDDGGRKVLKHFIMDFNSAFGATTEGPKTASVTHEYLFDFVDLAKSILTLGIWERPWQSRWRENNEKKSTSLAVGYFDNRYFNAGRFKTELPVRAFKDLTIGDGYWAAKIIMSFSDQDIAAMLRAAEYTDINDVNYLVDTLSKRRDLIGQFWFTKATALDNFKLDGGVLQFEDLAITHGFATKEATQYRADIFRKGRCLKKLASVDVQANSLDLKPWLAENEQIKVKFHVTRNGKRSCGSAYVKLKQNSIERISHEK